MTTLETERLRMRPWREDDFDDFAAYFTDAELARFVGGTCSREVAWRRFASYLGHWQLRGFGMFALEVKESGVFAGAAGPWFPEGWPELEIGYWLTRAVHGNGYATEAATRAKAYAFEELGAETLVSYIDPENAASIRVVERMGARYDSTIELGEHGPHSVYRHAR